MTTGLCTTIEIYEQKEEPREFETHRIKQISLQSPMSPTFLIKELKNIFIHKCTVVFLALFVVFGEEHECRDGFDSESCHDVFVWFFAGVEAYDDTLGPITMWVGGY